MISFFCKCFLNKKSLLFSLLIFSLNFFCFSEENEVVTTINIDNARRTEYKKDEVSQNDTIVLSGEVSLSIEKGETKTVINAEKVVYDRKTEILYADGNVQILTTGSSEDNISAESLVLNTSTLEGIFDGGKVIQTQSDAMQLPSGSTLIVFSKMFAKSEINTMTFKDSSLTFCDDEDPHWKINASRTWLLPGGEFAFLNALLYVGSVPVLYFPAFYYPKDELVFNPVFGNKKREGYFVQNTLYLYGRKPLNSTSSSSEDSDALEGLYNFMRPSVLKEQELEGLVLHNLDENYTGDTSNFFKIKVDWYSTLGAMAGLEGNFEPSETYVTNLSFRADFGFSNSIFYTNGIYNKFSPQGEMFYDHSTFLGFELPFRYGADFKLTLSKPFNLTLSLPVYSDPYFEYDFNERNETMDWISFLTGGNDDDDEDETISEVSSLVWRLSVSKTFSLPSSVKPYVSSASASINSTVNLSTLTNSTLTEENASYSPMRKFYYPSLVTPANASVSVSGTLFQWPSESSSNSKVSYDVPFIKPEEIMNEKEIQKKKEDQEKWEKELAQKKSLENQGENSESQVQTENTENSNTNLQNQNNQTQQIELPEFILTDISSSDSKKTLPELFTYKLSYSASANYAGQFSYGTSSLKQPEDFDWKNIRYYMYTLKIPVSLQSNMNVGGNFFTLSNKLAYDSLWQEHLNVSETEYTQTQRDSLYKTDKNAERQDFVSTNSVSLKPLSNIEMFSDTGISWNTTMKIFRKEFLGDEDKDEYLWLDWNDEDAVTSHTLDFTFSMKEFDSKFKQSLVFSSNLYPQVPKYSATLNLIFPYVSVSVSSSIQETSLTDSTIIKNPLQQSFTFSLPLSDFSSDFNSTVKFTESFNYNFEDNHPESLKLSLSWWAFSLSYVASYSQLYDFSVGNGWTVSGSGKEFQPYTLSFSFSPSKKTFYSWFNRISVAPTLSTSITADLVRPTSSYFIFSPGLTFNINEFLNISFSATSRNSVICRYFNSITNYEIPGEDNVFLDLLNSFRFDDRSKREASGFKLKSLNFSITHQLHDWDFNMTFKFEPRIITENGQRRYDFNPYITIGVLWRPMESIKTQITDDYGTWELN